MNILDHKLVLKYFYCECGDNPHHNCVGLRAEAILLAMQAPINKGEKYLYIEKDGEAREMEMVVQVIDNPIFFHPNHLRLPDRFQIHTHIWNCSCGARFSPEKVDRCPHGFKMGPEERCMYCEAEKL